MTKPPFNLLPMLQWTKQHIELLFWFVSIVLLFFLKPAEPQTSLCMFRWIGFEHCPGCGLGHSIHHALHASFTQSYNEHLMGLPALVIIFHRITQLVYPKKTTIYEK